MVLRCTCSTPRPVPRGLAAGERLCVRPASRHCEGHCDRRREPQQRMIAQHLPARLGLGLGLGLGRLALRTTALRAALCTADGAAV